MNQLLLNIAFVSSQLLLPALAFSIVYGLEGYFSFSFAITAAVAAYTCYAAHVCLGLNFLMAACFAVLFAMMWEPASRLLIFRPMIRRGANPMTCLLASIGLYVAASESIRLCFGPETKRILSPAGSVVHLFSGVLTFVQCASVVTALICTFGCVLLVKTTSAGRLWNAVRQNTALSVCFGVNVERVRLAGCILGAGIMGLAGIFAGADTGVDINIGINLLLMGVAVSILGGGRQPFQILICSLAVGLSRESIAWVIGGAWRDTIMFGAVALVICIRSVLKHPDCALHKETSSFQ